MAGQWWRRSEYGQELNVAIAHRTPAWVGCSCGAGCAETSTETTISPTPDILPQKGCGLHLESGRQSFLMILSAGDASSEEEQQQSPPNLHVDTL